MSGERAESTGGSQVSDTTETDVDVDELAARLERLETSHRVHESALLALEGQGGPTGANGPAAGQGAPLEPFYANVVEWVEGMFAPTFARYLGGTTHWCGRWWDHPEAVLRLEALWRSWETLRLDPTTGIGSWLREFLDPQRLILMSDDGPFKACNADSHADPPALPVAPLLQAVS